MSGKILEMPKSTAQLWSDLFNSFLRDIDKVASHISCQQTTKAVNHEDGTGAVANRKPSTEHADEGAAQSSSAPFTYPGDPGPEPLAEAVTKEDS